MIEMRIRDRRTTERKQTCIQAFATDLEDTIEVKCFVRDVTAVGCRIVSSNLYELPDQLQLIPEGFDKPINAKVVWRDKKTAGLNFMDECQLDDEHVKTLSKHSAVDMEDDVLDLMVEKKPLSYAERLQRMRTLK